MEGEQHIFEGGDAPALEKACMIGVCAALCCGHLSGGLFVCDAAPRLLAAAADSSSSVYSAPTAYDCCDMALCPCCQYWELFHSACGSAFSGLSTFAVQAGVNLLPGCCCCRPDNCPVTVLAAREGSMLVGCAGCWRFSAQVLQSPVAWLFRMAPRMVLLDAV